MSYIISKLKISLHYNKKKKKSELGIIFRIFTAKVLRLRSDGHKILEIWTRYYSQAYIYIYIYIYIH